MIFNMVGGANSTDNGEALSRKEVNFYDYEGTLLYAYSIEEANALTTLPDAPQHEGLLFQEWNYSLEDIQSTDRPIDVGANYITDDGKTRLYISIPPNSEPDRPPARNVVPLYISQTVSNGVTIDWGDGSPTETLAGTGNVNTTHTYANAGDYVITLDPIDECVLGFGDGTSRHCIMGSADEKGIVYINMLRMVNIGRSAASIGSSAFSSCFSLSNINIPRNVTNIGNNAFFACNSLSSITIPKSVTSIGNYAFSACSSLSNIVISKNVKSINFSTFDNCHSLKAITIPEGTASIGNSVFAYCSSLSSINIAYSVASIGDSAFSNCISLSNIDIPYSVTNIGKSAFRSCRSLSKIDIPESISDINQSVFFQCFSLSSITIPKNVTSIGGNAFSSCSGVKEFHIYPVIPPQLENPETFQGVSADCIFYVPKGSLSAYQTATNWAAYASQIKEEGT